MGTNYYWREGIKCPCCGHENELLHIGKSSCGWHFALHVYPDKNINTLDDWKKKFGKLFSSIEDEYGKKVSSKKMIDEITNRSHEKSSKINERWYKENYAHEGLNGLAACNVDGERCIGNSEGTWDYVVGDFS